MELPVSITRRGAPRHLIVSIDFGTTFSAVAFCNRGELTSHNDIHSVKRYKKAACQLSFPEVPSDLFYESKDVIRWGYDVRYNLNKNIPGHRIARFKLPLDNQPIFQEACQDVERALAQLPGDRTTESVIADYLEKLLEHTREYMQEIKHYEDGDMVELVCTVPAMWTPRARSLMVKAVENAQLHLKERGLDFVSDIKDLFLVSEPEAAAAFVLSSDSNLDLEENDVFIMCDAGGGTVVSPQIALQGTFPQAYVFRCALKDLITYQVVRVDPLRLREVVGGTGGLCGSSYVDIGFRKLLEEKLEAETYLDEMAGNGKQQKIEQATWEFEKCLKRGFQGEDDIAESVNIPGLRANAKKGFEVSIVNITCADREKVFDPVVDQIWDLIRDQIEHARKKGFQVKSLFSVGGFAESPYLKKHLQKRCESERPPLKLEQPETTAFAVASGAITRSLNKKHGPKRICDSSVGIVSMDRYNSESPLHEGAHPIFDTEEDDYFVPVCLEWLLIKGVELASNEEPKSRTYYRTIPMNERSITLSARFFTLDRDIDGNSYHVDHAMNKGCEPFEEVVFEFDEEKTKIIKQGLPKFPNKTGGSDVHLRRSGRQPKPTAKYSLTKHQEAKKQSKHDGKRTKHANLSNRIDAVLANGSSQDSSVIEIDDPGQKTPTALLEAQLQSTSLSQDSQRVQSPKNGSTEYYRLDYQVVLQVEAMKIKYRIECTVGGKTYTQDGRSNLAPLVAPGAS